MWYKIWKFFFDGKHFSSAGGYREILNIAYPLIIMSAGNTIMQFANRIFLAMNSTEDVAAALPGGILSFTLFSFFMVTANFTSALVAQYFGAEDYGSCVKASWTGFYFGLISALLIWFVLPYLGLFIIDISGHGASIVAREKEYFIYVMPSGGFVCMAAPFYAFFSGRGRTMTVAAANFTACLLNILLDYCLIFGNFGFPAMGIAGAGLATSLSSAFSLLCAFTMFIAVDQRLFETRSHRSFDWGMLRRLVRYGTPAGCQTFFDVSAFSLVIFMIGHLNAAALAASTIALAINQLSFLPLLGLMDATAIVVGQYIGKKRPEVVERAAANAWKIAMFFMCLAAAVYLLLPHVLIDFFAPKMKSNIDFMLVISTAVMILACAGIFNFFDATKFVFMGVLRGAGDTRAVMLIGVGCGWLLMAPGVTLLILVFKASVMTVWIFITVYLLAECLIMFARYRSGHWRKIRMIVR